MVVVKRRGGAGGGGIVRVKTLFCVWGVTFFPFPGGKKNRLGRCFVLCVASVEGECTNAAAVFRL